MADINGKVEQVYQIINDVVGLSQSYIKYPSESNGEQLRSVIKVS